MSKDPRNRNHGQRNKHRPPSEFQPRRKDIREAKLQTEAKKRAATAAHILRSHTEERVIAASPAWAAAKQQKQQMAKLAEQQARHEAALRTSASAKEAKRAAELAERERRLDAAILDIHTAGVDPSDWQLVHGRKAIPLRTRAASAPPPQTTTQGAITNDTLATRTASATRLFGAWRQGSPHTEIKPPDFRDTTEFPPLSPNL